MVYDRERNVGHCLNARAAATWKLCNGEGSTSDLVRILTKELAAAVDEPLVLVVSDELSKARLLIETEKPARRTSRRKAIGTRSITGAIALPPVTSLVAPTPVRAASCLPKGQGCIS